MMGLYESEDPQASNNVDKFLTDYFHQSVLRNSCTNNQTNDWSMSYSLYTTPVPLVRHENFDNSTYSNHFNPDIYESFVLNDNQQFLTEVANEKLLNTAYNQAVESSHNITSAALFLENIEKQSSGEATVPLVADVCESSHPEQVVESNKSYFCSVCFKGFSKKSTMVCHLRTHTGEKPFCCEHCGGLFSTKQNLTAHLVRYHGLITDSNQSCPHCGKLFYRQNAFSAHLLVHRQDSPFVCKVCCKRFRQKVTLDKHEATHSGDYNYCCFICGRKFETRLKMKRHLRRADDKEHKIEQGRKLGRCSSTDEVDSSSTVMENVEGPLRTGRLCPQCGKSLPTLTLYQTHLRQEHMEAVTCPYLDCSGKSFRTAKLLNKHTNRKHNSNRVKFYCELCGAEYLKKCNLQSHVDRVHALRPSIHSCHLCFKMYSTIDKLRLHVKQHSQVPYFKCEICGKVFRRNDILKKHLGTHSKKKSSNFSCSQCDKGFKSAEALSYHEATHAGHFKFTCETCGKGFVRRCHLEGHLKLHLTGERRPYGCHLCGKSYRSYKNLKEHSKLKHGPPHRTVTHFYRTIRRC